jgi:hypothetical protein
LGKDFFDGSPEPPVVLDAPLAFPGDLFAERLGRAFAPQEPGPAVIEPVELGRFAFAGAVGLAAGAGGGGDAARQQGSQDFQNDYFCFLGLYPNLYIH